MCTQCSASIPCLRRRALPETRVRARRDGANCERAAAGRSACVAVLWSLALVLSVRMCRRI